MNATEQYVNADIEHLHDVAVYENTIYLQLRKYLNNIKKRITKELLQYALIVKWTSLDKKNLKAKVKLIQDEELLKLKTTLFGNLDSFGKVETQFQYNTIKNIFKKYDLKISSINKADSTEDTIKLTSKYLRYNIVLEKEGTFSPTKLYNRFELKERSIVDGILAVGFALQKNGVDMQDELFNSPNKFPSSYRHLETTNQTLNQSMMAVATAYFLKTKNAQLFSGYLWSSVMDERTTPICSFLNGKYWIYNHPELSTLSSEQYAPAHYHCRSSNPPIFRSLTSLGYDPEKFSVETKTAFGESIVQQPTYSEWFKTQSITTQKNILGTTRYALYKSGNIKVPEFYSLDKTRLLTLSELRMKVNNL